MLFERSEPSSVARSKKSAIFNVLCRLEGDLDNATQVLNLLEKQASKSLNLLPAYNCLLRKYISLGYTGRISWRL